MSKPLTDAEIAELRKLYAGGEATVLEWRAAVLAAHPFLLDEVEAARKRPRQTAIDYMRDVLKKAGADLTFTPEGPRLFVPELDRARALLKRIEWEGGDDCGDPQCPACYGMAPNSGAREIGHRADCELAALIGGK